VSSTFTPATFTEPSLLPPRVLPNLSKMQKKA
jgi:hypothetical protein